MTAASFAYLKVPTTRAAFPSLGSFVMPMSPWPLAWFRIGLSAVLLVQALSLIGHLDDLYGRHGIVEWNVNSESWPAAVPSVAWLDHALVRVRMSQAYAVPLTFAVYIASLASLLLGYRTRLSAVVAWLAHTAFNATGELSIYGVDRFAQIGLFYCIFFPVGEVMSLDTAARREGQTPTFAASLARRLLQLHVIIAYTASGLEKALGEQWWNGEAIFRAIMGMSDSPIDCSFLAGVPWLARILCWTTLMLEAGAALFVLHPRLRKLWLFGIVSMHLGIAVVLGLWTFSATMIVFDMAAFGFRSLTTSATQRHIP